MKIYGTGSKEFQKSLQCFNEVPEKIPASSIMVCSETKAISLICIYYDAGMIFIHGLFKSKFCTDYEFKKSIIVLENFIKNSLVGKIPVICYSNTHSLKKLFIRNKFNEETISMLVREV